MIILALIMSMYSLYTEYAFSLYPSWIYFVNFSS